MFITFTWKTSFYSDSLRYDYNHIAKMLYNDTSFFSKIFQKIMANNLRFWMQLQIFISIQWQVYVNLWNWNSFHFQTKKKKFKIRSFIMMSMMEKKIHLFWTFFFSWGVCMCVYKKIPAMIFLWTKTKMIEIILFK